MTLDDEERALVRRLREGDDAALDALRACWLRRIGVGEAVDAVAGEPLNGSAAAVVRARVVLLWVAGARRWDVVAFEREE